MRRLALCALASLLIISTAPPRPAAAQDRLQVVASFSILADVAANVAGDAADVRALVPAGSDPHGFTPTPQDMVALADADVVFLVGAGFEEGLDAALANIGAVHLVEASACVDILPFGGGSDPAPTAAPTASAPDDDGAGRPMRGRSGRAGCPS